MSLQIQEPTSTMRAMVIKQQGPPSVLQLVSDFPKPVRKAGELLVKVTATSVNPIDWKTREGKQVPKMFMTFPKVRPVA